MKSKVAFFVVLPITVAVVLGGAYIFEDKRYAWISLCVALLSCVPVILNFEKGRENTKELIIIAVMVALSSVGRMIFAPIPGFKPVTAMVVITAMYFGSEAGFMTGALSALISNIYFGQGPWTPFQMLSWGIIGAIAGIAAKLLKKSRVALCVFAVISGVLYSMLMDVWTVLWADGYFNIARYVAAVVSATQFTVVYAVSNVVFLLLLIKPIGKILERIKTKYGL